MNKLENSHLVQVNTPTRSIWRGREETKIQLDVKVDQRFLAQSSINRAHTYQLHAYVENCSTKAVHLSGIDGLGLYFDQQQNNQKSKGGNAGTVNIKYDPYFKLTGCIHKKMFRDYDEIRVIVEAIPQFSGCNIVVFGASQVIS